MSVEKATSSFLSVTARTTQPGNNWKTQSTCATFVYGASCAH